VHTFLQHTFYSKYWHWLHSIMFGSHLVTIAVQMCLTFGCELWPKAPGKFRNWTGKLPEFFSSKRVGTLYKCAAQTTQTILICPEWSWSWSTPSDHVKLWSRQPYFSPILTSLSEWVSSFLTAHQHILGYLVPYNGKNVIKVWRYNQGHLATINAK